MEQTGERRRVGRDVAVLLGLSAVFRLVYAWAVPRVLDSADAVRYLETARTFARGDFFAVDPKIPVLYPAFTAAAHLFFRDIEQAGQSVSFLFSALLVVPVYFLARALHGEKTARMAGAIVSLWPWLIDYSNRVATEPTAVFFWMLGALCLVRGLEAAGGVRWMFAAALSFATLDFARPEGTFIALGALGMWAFAAPGERRAAARTFVVYGATLAAALLLHAVYMHKLVGVWALNYRVGFIGEQPEGSTVFAEFGKTLVAMTADVPAVMLGPLLWAFFGIGLVVSGDREPRRWRAETAVLYLAALQWLVVIPVLSPAPRYLMAAFVVWSLWSARGVVVAGDLLTSSSSRTWTRALPAAVVTAWMLLHLGAAIAAERWNGGDAPRQPWEYKAAGLWMRDHLEPGTIVTRKPQVGFYAEMPTVGVAADTSIEEIIAAAQAQGSAYLVVDERYTATLVPALRPLLDPANAPPGLRLVNADALPYAGARVVIYQFTRPK